MNPNVIRLRLKSRWLGKRVSFRLDSGNKCRLPWESSEEGRLPWTRSHEKVIHARCFMMARSTKYRFTRKDNKIKPTIRIKMISRDLVSFFIYHKRARTQIYICIYKKLWIAIYVSYNRSNHMELAYRPSNLHVCSMNIQYSLYWRRLEENTHTILNKTLRFQGIFWYL